MPRRSTWTVVALRTRYEILAQLMEPNGNAAWLHTSGIILAGETAPGFVMLIPAERP
jgi:hypothetical protein